MVRDREQGASSHSRAQSRGSNQRHGWIPTVIVDNSAVFRAGLVHILAGTRFRVMGGCTSLEDIKKGALNGRVRLALVGIDKDTRALLTELSVLKARHENLRIVIFSERFDLEELLTVIGSGGDCYLLKNEISPEALLMALDLVLLGGTIVPQGFAHLIRSQLRVEQDALSGNGSVTRLLEDPRSRFPNEAAQTAENAPLSNREEMILRHMAQGASNKHIARDLNITEATVKTHVKALLHKIRARNRTQAAVWAINHLGPQCIDGEASLKRGGGLPALSAQLGD